MSAYIMPTAPNTLAQDKERYRRGEIVRTTQAEWIEPLFESIEIKTGVKVESIEDRSGTAYDFVNEKRFPQAGMWDRALNFFAHYKVHLSSEHKKISYSIKWQESHPSAEGHPVLQLIDAGTNKLIYNKYDKGGLSYPMRSCTTYKPLAPFLAHIIARDLIRREAVKSEHMISALDCAGLLNPKLKHALATLKGVQKHVTELTEDAMRADI